VLFFFDSLLFVIFPGLGFFVKFNLGSFQEEKSSSYFQFLSPLF